MSKKINTAYNESLNVKFKNSAVKNIDQHKSDLPQFRNN